MPLKQLSAAVAVGLLALQAGTASAATPSPTPKPTSKSTSKPSPTTSKSLAPSPGPASPDDPTQTTHDSGSWWVQPAPKPSDPNVRDYFILFGNPGDTLQDGLAISNYTDHAITYDVYGADGYNTPRDGAFALRDFGFPMSGVGSWVKPAYPSVTVAAHTATVVPVTITIPADATPGDHIGGVSGMDIAVESVQKQGNIRVGIKRVVAARLYLRVNGPIVGGLTVTRLKASAPSPFPAYVSQADGTISASVTNTGNLLLSPKAHIVVKGLFGTLFDKTVSMSAIIPGQSVDLNQVWSRVPPFEIASVKVDVTDDSAAPPVTASASTSFTAIPWYTLLLLLLIAAAAIGGRRYWKRRVRASRGAMRGGRKGNGAMRTRSSVQTNSAP